MAVLECKDRVVAERGFNYGYIYYFAVHSKRGHKELRDAYAMGKVWRPPDLQQNAAVL